MRKILLLVHQFLPDFYGGTEILTLSTAKELKQRGYEVIIFTGLTFSKSINEKDRFDSYVYEGISVQRFNHTYEPMGRQTNISELEYNNLFFADYFRNFLKTWKPDIVHIFHLHRLSASMLDVCVELGVPVVYSATDFWMICPLCQLLLPDNSLCAGPKKKAVNCIRHKVNISGSSEIKKIKFLMQFIPDWLLFLLVTAIRKGIFTKYRVAPLALGLSERPDFFRKRMNYINMVFTPTRFMKKMLIRNGLEQQRVRYLPFGIDMKNMTFDPSRGKNEYLRIGFIGTISEHKGVHLLVKAVKSLGTGIKVDLKIYGTPDHFPDYYKYLYNLSLDDERIKFCGTFPNDQIEKIFSELDVLVVPSIWYENTPLVIYSAQAAGCPVIGTNLDGISEVIEHEVNGLLFKKGDIRGLAKSILRLVNDRKLLLKLSNNSKKPKSISEYVSEFEYWYKEILNRKEMN